MILLLSLLLATNEERPLLNAANSAQPLTQTFTRNHEIFAEQNLYQNNSTKMSTNLRRIGIFMLIPAIGIQIFMATRSHTDSNTSCRLYGVSYCSCNGGSSCRTDCTATSSSCLDLIEDMQTIFKLSLASCALGIFSIICFGISQRS